LAGADFFAGAAFLTGAFLAGAAFFAGAFDATFFAGAFLAGAFFLVAMMISFNELSPVLPREATTRKGVTQRLTATSTAMDVPSMATVRSRLEFHTTSTARVSPAIRPSWGAN